MAGNRLAADVDLDLHDGERPAAPRAYLSDLAYTVTANGWGPVEKDRSNGEQAAGDGKPITLNGTVFAKGLGIHAASDIRYTMSSCTTFTAKVGVDDEIANTRLGRLPGLPRRHRGLRLGDDDRGQPRPSGQRQHHRQDAPSAWSSPTAATTSTTATATGPTPS